MTRAVASAPKLPPSSASSLGRVRGRCHLQTRRASLPPHSPPPRPLFPTTHHLNVSDPLWRVQRPPATPSLADDVLKSISGGQDSWQDHRPPDERTLRLGKTLRTLSPILPHIFTQSLPPWIVSPEISLHLFPSTHPHLPAVKGRVPYRAALWTAPVAWGSVPIVGNVGLEILSERIVRTGHAAQPQFDQPSPDDPAYLDLGGDKLVVKWKTKNKSDAGSGNHLLANSQNSSQVAHFTTSIKPPSSSSHPSSSTTAAPNSTPSINRTLSHLLGGDQPLFRLRKSNNDTNTNEPDPFTGLFIFTFDRQGRIASHTIEHVDRCSDDADKKTSRFITLTDWLLGRAKWRTLTTEEEKRRGGGGIGDHGGGGQGGLIPGLAMSRLRKDRR